MRMETQIPTLCPMHALSMQTEDGDENWNRSQNLECHSFSSTCPCQFVGHRSSKVFLAHIGIVPSVIVWGDERRNECRLQAPSNLFSATSFCNLRLKFASFFSRGNVSSWIEARWGFPPNALGFDHEWMLFSCSPISRLVLPLCRRLGGILGQGQGRLLSREAEPRHPGCWRLASTVLSQNTSPVQPLDSCCMDTPWPNTFHWTDYADTSDQCCILTQDSWVKILERSFSEWLCDILTRQSQIHESKTDDGECILLDLIYMIYIWSMDRNSRTRLQIPLKTTLLIALLIKALAGK